MIIFYLEIFFICNLWDISKVFHQLWRVLICYDIVILSALILDIGTIGAIVGNVIERISGFI